MKLAIGGGIRPVEGKWASKDDLRAVDCRIGSSVIRYKLMYGVGEEESSK